MAFYKCYRHPHLRIAGLIHLCCSLWHPAGRDSEVSHRQPGTLLTFLPQNCYFGYGTSQHLSEFPSQLLSALSVHSTGSCRMWVTFTCVSACCLAKCCCTQYSWCGAKALSVLIQDKQGRRPEWFDLHQRESSYEKYSIT